MGCNRGPNPGSCSSLSQVSNKKLSEKCNQRNFPFQLRGSGKYCGMHMHISTLCSYRPSNDPTVDQQPYGSSVSYISQTYSYISVSLGAAHLSSPLLSVCLSSLHNCPERSHERRFLRQHSDMLLFLCGVAVRTCFLMLLRAKAIPRRKTQHK